MLPSGSLNGTNTMCLRYALASVFTWSTCVAIFCSYVASFSAGVLPGHWYGKPRWMSVM
jgi:hypothetical protein